MSDLFRGPGSGDGTGYRYGDGRGDGTGDGAAGDGDGDGGGASFGDGYNGDGCGDGNDGYSDGYPERWLCDGIAAIASVAAREQLEGVELELLLELAAGRSA